MLSKRGTACKVVRQKARAGNEAIWQIKILPWLGVGIEPTAEQHPVRAKGAQSLRAACLTPGETFVTLSLSEQERKISVLLCIAEIAAAKLGCSRYMESDVTRPIQGPD